MNLKDENYKGYAIKFVEKIMEGKGNKPNVKIVQAITKSKITGKILGDIGNSKDAALSKVKKIIDTDKKYKDLKMK